MDFVVSLMLFAGILGGTAYCLVNYHPLNPDVLPGQPVAGGSWSVGGLIAWAWRLFISILLGITAASVVPVFLHATSSNLISEVREFAAAQEAGNAAPGGQAPTETNSSAPYVFFGFCVLAAYAAQRFLQAMLNRLLREIEEQRVRTDRAEAAAREARRIAEAVEENVTARDAGATLTAAVRTGLSDDEKKVLRVLSGAWWDQGRTRVTAAGIARQSGLSAPVVQTTLDSLAGKSLTEVRDQQGETVWGLTPAGTRWRP